MKLDNILRENNMLTYGELNSMQIRVLVGLATGKLSDETASEREQVVLDQLRDFGLVDNFGELTPTGLKAAELGKKYGSLDRKRAAVRDAALNRTGRPSIDTGEEDALGYEDEDVVPGL